jgi:hypothetical protein
MKRSFAVLASAVLAAQAQVKPVVSQRSLSEQANIIRLAPRYATAIRMPEAVSSVIVGDAEKFLAEHSEKEPALVFVKPVVEDRAESNLLVTTIRGRQVSFVLRSEGGGSKLVDFLVTYKPAGTFLIEESGIGTVEIPATASLRSGAELSNGASARPAAFERGATASKGEADREPLDGMLERQQRAALPVLYGMRAPSPEGKGDHVRAGVSEVIDAGRTVVVLFSVVNPREQAIEILPPQIQLAGRMRKGFVIRRSRWGTSEQLPVKEFRLSRRRLGAGERADGVVVFTRPNFKQSSESLFLHIAESGAVDKPALAPVGFGVSAIRKEARSGE